MSSEDKKKIKTSSVLDQWRNRKKTGLPQGVKPRPAEAQTIASKSQRGLWLLQQLYPGNTFYQYAHLYKIKGELNLGYLNQSFQKLIDRHEILRANFIKDDQALVLKINPTALFSCELIDISDLSPKEQFEKADLVIAEKSRQTFDLSKDLLLRVWVLKFSDSDYQMVLSMHHIIGDRWSLRLLNEELFAYYKGLKNEEEVSLEPLSIQYADYAYWQQNKKTKIEDLDYWLENMSGDLPLLTLPGDYKRPQTPSFKGAIVSKKLDTDLSAKLQKQAKGAGVTMYVLMLAAFKTLLYKYTNQQDLIIGSPFSNRDKVALEKLIGFFNETLVLRTQIEAEWTFRTLLNAVKNTTSKAFEHKNVPFEELVRTLQPERHGSANPLFQSMFLYNSESPFLNSGLDLSITEQTVDLGVSKFDLTLFVTDYAEHLELSLEFSLDLFKKERAERMLRHLEVILQQVVLDDQLPLAQIPLLDEQESRQILQDWNDTALELPDYQSIHQLIEEQAERNPLQPAVAFQEDQISYAELNRQANAIAACLMEAGVQPNQSVGLYADRSIALMTGILGILKAGAAYLPLDPEYPAERIDFMIEDSGATLILSQEALLESLASSKASILTIETAIAKQVSDDWQKPEVSSDHLAYIIYTSGSTGQPKGVPIRHKNLLHSTLARYTFYPSNPEAFLLLSSFSFDSSVVGIFWTLCSGGTIVLPPKRMEQDVFQLTELIARHNVTHTLMLPSLYSAILGHAQTEQIQSLKNVMVAGEACPFLLIEKHYQRLPDTVLYNEYGPTEASVWCIAHEIKADEKDFVPIGKAIPNTEVYILNKDLQPLPIGVPGELFIGGLGVAEGYLNRPALTAERFLDHPFKKGAKLYRTGDLARFHSNGNIEFLGRVDHQVKIRGFRVEPDEIEKSILTFKGVEEALVIVHQPAAENQVGQKRLIAYVLEMAESEIAALRDFLSSKLPAYMVPALFIPLKTFPRLPNGKINRKALPDPDTFTTNEGENFLAPQSELEIQLAKIWEEVLGLKSVGLSDNFFSIGGDSILSIQIVSKARERGIFLSPNQLFEYQTIATLVRSVEQSAVTDFETVKTDIVLNNPLNYPLSYLQKAFLFNSQSSETDQGLLQLEFTINGAINVDDFKSAWQQSAKRHDAMRAFIAVEKEQVPHQVIAPEVSLKWQLLDWQDKTTVEQDLALAELREVDQKEGLILYQAPVFRMCLIQLGADKNLLFWTCHHIFLDGWSCGIILKDALAFYEAIGKKEKLNLSPLPNYPAYLEWKEKQGPSAAEQFWAKELADFKKLLLFKKSSNKAPQYKDEFLQLTKEESAVLETFCQQNNIAISTLFQGFWALLLSRYFDSKDVVFGLTVSGRFAAFPQIESTAGLFMNVIPNRFVLQNEKPLAQWLKAIQKDQGKKSQYEGCSLDEIQSWINWPYHIALFESLFVFGNYLKNGLKSGNLEVEHFQGGFSAAYPLTIRVNPLTEIAIDWRYDSAVILPEQIAWIKNTFHGLIKKVSNWDETTIQQVLAEMEFDLPIQELKDITAISSHPVTNRNKAALLLPRNQTELQLCNIWEQVFNRKNIGVEDNFFDLGGNSIMAIQLFSKIEKDMELVLPPSLLFQYPTIAGIAKSINSDTDKSNTDTSLVPLRATGNKPPLFCVHGGGAHVFFYKNFANYLPDHQPVYSFQPPGLDGGSAFPASIEEMAAHYIDVLKTVQQHGPYHLLGTCFSNAVVLEMAAQLKQQGEKIESLFIIDSGPVHLFGDDDGGSRKTIKRFFDMLKRGDFNRIQSKIKGRFRRKKQRDPVRVVAESTSEEQLRLTIDLLNKLYAEYHWKAFDGRIHFIRSREFHQRADKKYHLTQWNKLAKKGIDLHVVDGHHLTLFEEPEVEGLADKVSQILN